MFYLSHYLNPKDREVLVVTRKGSKNPKNFRFVRIMLEKALCRLAAGCIRWKDP